MDIEKTIRALTGRGFAVQHFATGREAADYLDGAIDGTTVGIGGSKTIDQLEEKEWDFVLDVGLKGLFLMSKHVIPEMRKVGGGSIVNTGSGWGLKGGDLAEELALTGKRWHVYDIPRFFGEEFFETKKVVYTPR